MRGQVHNKPFLEPNHDAFFVHCTLPDCVIFERQRCRFAGLQCNAQNQAYLVTAHQAQEQKLAWQQLGRPQPLAADILNSRTIVPEVLPVVFVPGIMGSRLSGPVGGVWDPDDAAAFCTTMGAGLYNRASRSAAMVGPQGYHPQHLWLPERASRFDPLHSWDNLVQAAYRGVQAQLGRATWSKAMQLCFNLPAYAFAYNWTQSPDTAGAELAHFIARIIAQNHGERPCRRVIVVTHSMGGIVARAASLLHGARSHILGMVHVCQPMAGAPALYLAIKSGFKAAPLRRGPVAAGVRTMAEGIVLANLLGSTGAVVAPVLGQMPGALSLLPNHLYTNTSGRPDWLTLQAERAGPVQHSLPAVLDPYEEVYRARGTVACLFNAPPACSHHSPSCQKENCWQRTWADLDDVEHLHRRLGNRCHPNTFHIAGTSVPTEDGAHFLCTGAPHLRARLTLNDAPVPYRNAQTARSGLTRVELGDGDGTVCIASALCGVEDMSTVDLVADVEHSSAMMAPAVMDRLKKRIKQIAHDAIAEGFAAEQRKA